MSAAVLTLFAAPLFGDPNPPTSETSADESSSHTIPIKLPGESLVARVERTKRWTLSIGDPDGIRTLGQNPLPEWAAPDEYVYSVETHPVQGIHTLLFTAAPKKPGTDNEVWRSIWTPSSKKAKSTWFQVVNGTWSPIEGGDEIFFRQNASSWELIRRRDRPGARFCGTNDFAFERFDANTRSFSQLLDAKQLTDGADNARVILPKTPIEATTLVHFYRWHSASSDRHNPSDSLTVIRPNELGDDDLSSAWMEGAPGDGHGEFVTARISPHFAVTGIRIAPGAGESPATYGAFARPKKLLLTLGNKERYIIDLPDVSYDTMRNSGGLIVSFDTPVKTTCMSAILLEATIGKPEAGSKLEWAKNFVAISEITPLSELHGTPRHEAVNRITDRLLAPDLPRKSIAPILALAANVEAEIVGRLDGQVRRADSKELARIVNILARVTSDRAIETMVRVFFRADLNDENRRTIKKALRKHPQATQKSLLAAISTPPLDPRRHADALRILGRGSHGTGLLTLLDQLGSGADQVRLERVRALARLGQSVVDRLREWPLERFGGPMGTDALRALVMVGRYAKGQSKSTPIDPKPWPVLSALTGKGRPRAVRVLAIRALGIHPTPEAHITLLNRIENDGDPIIRSFSLQSLSALRHRSHDVYIKALVDPSPDVRIAAIRSISKLPSDDTTSLFANIVQYTETETWPTGLEIGYRMLSKDPRARDTLIDVMKQSGDPRRALIVRVMARTGTPLPLSILEDVVHAPEIDPSICRYAIDHLGLLLVPQSQALLVEILQGRRLMGLDSDQSLRLRARAAHALGRHRDETAYQELYRIAVNKKEAMALRVAAVRAFALFRDPRLVDSLEGMRQAISDPLLLRELEDAQRMIQRRSLLNEIKAGIDANPEATEEEE